MHRLATLFTLLVAATPAMAQPYPDQPYPYEPADVDLDLDLDASIYADVNVAPIGEEVPDVAVFYDRLSPYGTWIDDPVYGYVFVPADTGYVPYTNGYWKLTDFGWTWIAADPHGWATSHYGRWVWRNRWVWRPDTTWGPAWVQWREIDNVVGWAPLGYDVDAYIPETNWRFVPTVYITSADISRYYVRNNVARYLRDSRPIVRWNRHSDRRWVAGPDRAYLERHKVRVQRATYQPREVGRFDAQERRQLEERAAQAKVKYRARVTRDAQVRTQLETRRATVERRQVELQRQRARDQSRVDRRRAEQAREVQQRQTEQRRRAEQTREVQQRQTEQRAEQAKKRAEVQQRQAEQRQLVEKQRAGQREQQQRARQQVEERKLQDKQHEQNERRLLDERKQQAQQRQQAEQRRDQPRPRAEQRREQPPQRVQRQRVEPPRDESQKTRSEERRARDKKDDRKK